MAFSLMKSKPEKKSQNTMIIEAPGVTISTSAGDVSVPEEFDTSLSKQDVKRKAKELVGKKFILGKTYKLKQKSICGSKEIVKKYKLKKFIYASKDKILNVLIMKQVEGPQGTIFTLNRNDCKRYHIKYEPGLQVFSMEFNWILCKD